VTRRRWIVLAAASALAAACTGTAAVLARDDTARATAPTPVLVASTTTSNIPTTVVPAPTTAPPLPVPEPPPDDPYENVPVARIGAIHIPKIGLQHAIYEGVWLTVLDVGPGHWPGTAMPGERGNAVFPGHRVTHSAPFLDLDRLEPGDEIVFQLPTGDVVYHVRETIIVEPTDMWVVDQTETATVTLIACHPKHSAAQRIVVKGDLAAHIPKPA
jgi:sortase A